MKEIKDEDIIKAALENSSWRDFEHLLPRDRDCDTQYPVRRAAELAQTIDSAPRGPDEEQEGLILRPEVQRFAHALERRLRRNDHKSGWEYMSVRECLDRADDEREELEQELVQPTVNVRAARREIEDAANFLLFAWHNVESE